MNKISKKTAFGLTGAAAATLMVAGFAAPAMADDTTTNHSADTTTTATSLTAGLSDLFRTGDVSNSSPLVLAPSVDAGGVLNGNALLSGNDVQAPVASGNETPIASGNDTSVSDVLNPSTSVDPNVANGSGNGTSVSAGDIGASVDDLVDGGNIGTNVDNLVGDILGDLGLGIE